MIANPILLQRKYARIIELFSQKTGTTLDESLEFFYHSNEYKLLREGVSDLHCMSDDYIVEDLILEYNS